MTAPGTVAVIQRGACTDVWSGAKMWSDEVCYAVMILELHHVQLAMPEGGEAEARDFYVDTLGLTEIEKPEELRSRGGAWFEVGSVRIHLGVETPFSAAKKAHPAFRVLSLERTLAVLEARGVQFNKDIDLPGIRRAYVNDPFGNRIELLETM